MVARVLIIHHDTPIRTKLEDLIRSRHDLEGAKDLMSGVKQLARRRPDVIVIGEDTKKEEGTRLLKYLKDNEIKIPVVVVASRGTGTHQPIAMKLGARAFIEFPVDEGRLESAISSALSAHAASLAGPPPITEDEQRGNLTMMEKQLNQRMKCFAGRNQVFLQSIVLGGATTRPRICLKCSLRGEYGMNKDVYYEWIRDVCCTDPMKCEAARKFQIERESA